MGICWNFAFAITVKVILRHSVQCDLVNKFGRFVYVTLIIFILHYTMKFDYLRKFINIYHRF